MRKGSARGLTLFRAIEGASHEPRHRIRAHWMGLEDRVEQDAQKLERAARRSAYARIFREVFRFKVNFDTSEGQTLTFLLGRICTVFVLRAARRTDFADDGAGDGMAWRCRQIQRRFRS